MSDINWERFIVDSAVVVALIAAAASLLTVVGTIISVFVSNFSVAKKVTDRLDALKLGEQHAARKEEHVGLSRDRLELSKEHTILLERSNIIKDIRDDQLRGSSMRKQRLEALKEDEKIVAQSIRVLDGFSEIWQQSNLENINLKKENANLKRDNAKFKEEISRLSDRLSRYERQPPAAHGHDHSHELNLEEEYEIEI